MELKNENLNSDGKCVIAHYHEVALKKGNRPRFVSRLVDNIKVSLSDLGIRDVKALMGRIGIFFNGTVSMEEVKQRLEKVFGIAYFSPAYRTSHSIEGTEKAILKMLKAKKMDFKSFAVKTKRGFKGFPLTSPEINARVGAYIKEHTSAKVDLKNPELSIFIEVIPKEIFFSFERFRGASGIPAGISGNVCCLISGGIDSPVAAYRLMKRGCSVIFIHFHSYPYLDKTAQDKVMELVKNLNAYQFSSKLYLVPFGEIQREISVTVEPAYRVVLYRRMMLRIAREIALKEGARALITGESLGQVASQTLDNMTTIESAVSMPILRPLIGMDKDEIIEEAKRIKTFDTSIMPDQDCCQLFVPKHPSTRTKVREIEFKERSIDIDEMMKKALDGLEEKRFFYPKTS